MKGLDSEAEVYVLLVAGVGVGVVGGAVVKPIALAEFAADEEAKSHGAEPGGDPAYGLDEGGFFFAFVTVPVSVVGKGDGAVDGRVLGGSAFVAGCGAKHHDLDDISGPLVLRETVVRSSCCFRVIGSLDAKNDERLQLDGIEVRGREAGFSTTAANAPPSVEMTDLPARSRSPRGSPGCRGGW